jgi:AraC-like DNA-binding protein
MYFELLQLRLIAHVQQRVQRGELTERALARHTGISQPHLHNMLKGARALSPHMADLLLHYLHDLSLEETAAILDIPVGTAKSRLHYGVATLRKYLTLERKLV